MRAWYLKREAAIRIIWQEIFDFKERIIMKITMAHGSGGKSTDELIDKIFAKHFSNEILDKMEDSALVEGGKKMAFTTDSFVVDPVQFPGGNIGRLCICGTVNDLLMRGAIPKYLTCGFIIEEGADTDELEEIVKSMAETARESKVLIVAGDTKVVQGRGGMYINTSGIGFIPEDVDISAYNIKSGDVLIVSGTMGDHHSAILSSRMNIENDIISDVAPLNEMVHNLIENGIEIHTLRDVTRGGLATVLKELAKTSKVDIDIQADIPVRDSVEKLCGLLGLDPMYMGNEGKLVAFIPQNQEKKALDIIRHSKYGENARVIGKVTKGTGQVRQQTAIGGVRNIEALTGEGLPRIC